MCSRTMLTVGLGILTVLMFVFMVATSETDSPMADPACGLSLLLFIAFCVSLLSHLPEYPSPAETAQIKALVKRLDQDQLPELLKRWQAGERSLELMTHLAHNLIRVGQPEQAEYYAAQACQRNIQHIPSPSQRILADNAYLALGLAHLYQGKFTEAAQDFAAHQSHANNRYLFILYTAWAHLLAGDEHLARGQIKQFDLAQNVQLPNYPFKFMLLYMQHRLLERNLRARLNEYHVGIGALLTDLERQKNPAYRAGIQPVLEDICARLSRGWFYRAVLAIHLEQTAELRASLELKREQGDRFYQNTLLLAETHLYFGEGHAAEPLAHEALAALNTDPHLTDKKKHGDADHDYAVYLAQHMVHEALLLQGRFREAAEFLIPHIPFSERPNRDTYYVALAYYLAGEDNLARLRLSRLEPSDASPANNLLFRYELMIAYLKYKLGMDRSPQPIRDWIEYLTFWDDAIARMMDNPYRRALQAMVDDIRAITGSEQSPLLAEN